MAAEQRDQADRKGHHGDDQRQHGTYGPDDVTSLGACRSSIRCRGGAGLVRITVDHSVNVPVVGNLGVEPSLPCSQSRRVTVSLVPGNACMRGPPGTRTPCLLFAGQVLFRMS